MPLKYFPFPINFFFFETIYMDKILKEIKNLKPSKATQESDVPTKIVKESAELFADVLFSSFDEYVRLASKKLF